MSFVTAMNANDSNKHFMQTRSPGGVAFLQQIRRSSQGLWEQDRETGRMINLRRSG